MRAPPSPDLPGFRVNYLGHAFQVASATSRAIHLELLPDMSTGVFLRGFKRFLARRCTSDDAIHGNFNTFKATVDKRFMLLQRVKQNLNHNIISILRIQVLSSGTCKEGDPVWSGIKIKTDL